MGHNHTTNLANLVGLGLVAVPLDVNHIGDVCFSKEVVAASGPFQEAQMQKKSAQILECQVGVRSSAQYRLKCSPG